MNDTQQQQLVTASLVENNQRLTFLPSYFGPHLMIRSESLVYAWLKCLSEDYNGGYWHYYTLTNGGFYLAPNLDGHLRIVIKDNWFSGKMSADAAGIVATLFALGHLAAEYQDTDAADALIDRYHLLREFVNGHAEADSIFDAID